MQISPCRRDAAMAQGSLHEMHRGASIERMATVAMPEPMRRHVLLDARPSRRRPHDPERLRRAERRALAGEEHGSVIADLATDGAEQRNAQSGRGSSRADPAPLARPVRRSNSRAWGEHHGALNGRMLPIEIPTGTEAFRRGEKLPFIRQDLLMVDQFPHILRCGKTAPAKPIPGRSRWHPPEWRHGSRRRCL